MFCAFQILRLQRIGFLPALLTCVITGQCYDGAAAMRGKRNGLKTLILKSNPKAHYIHCYAHSLQLAIQDSVKDSPLMISAFGVCSEVAKLIRNFPKRSTSLAKLKEEIAEPSVGIRTLCSTR